MAHPVSPLAPATFPTLPPIKGVRLATGAVGVRYQGRTDVMLAELAAGTSVAGCYTRSLTRSAPVDWCREAQKGGSARAIIVNSGNANAFTGSVGEASVKRTVEAAAKLLGCKPTEVFVASTGVIGEPLPDNKITDGLPAIRQKLAEDAWFEAAKAIMTTDTYPKGSTATATVDGVKVTVNGIAKGSGMIAPDMATMLAFLFTDAAVSPEALQAMLTPAVDKSFNCVTVDGDTSTSDTVTLCATGAAGHAPITSASDPRARSLKKAILKVLTDLALDVTKDGEGAEKLITIEVRGAASAKAARKVGLAIANSPLVKTAVAGEDANWGRVVMAVGKSGEKADRDKLSIWFGGHQVAINGQRLEGYDETPVVAHFKTRDVRIAVDLGIGGGKATVWTCDLTHRYIDINGSYRS
ncbi:bifunctional glutamate N-acetyltransferase/amino-acid acetyltransferase ArgJ [Lacibacterium aquatile]|uniref:Arginine biosynthesis bifunctional protein ArgJ n=1 Tax=Lacibacterium aquatile TaxID=1168082 RepID=A0ABW5DV10_9PROT